MHNANYDEPDESQSEDTSHVALLPKSVLMGKSFRVGDEVVLKITALRGSEVEVEYAKENTSEPEHPDDETEPDEKRPDYDSGEPEQDQGVGEQEPADMMAE